jgi:putative FmdB family regulatory protein
MPLYEYRCQNCNETFEVLQKFSDSPLTVHASCGGKVDRLLSAPGLQFKGSGWYITDYARSGSGKSPNGKSDGKSETKSESKSDVKPAASSTPAKSD